MKIPTFSSLEDHLNSICQHGMKQEVFPCVAAAVSKDFGNGRERIISSLGTTRLDKNGMTITRSTFFDLASLTKPLATALLVLFLIEKGVFDLEDRYSDLSCLKMPADKKNITIAQLLSHSSGILSYRPYFELYSPYSDKDNKKIIIHQILNDPLEYEIGTDCRYSDLGFILLGDLVEQLSGKSLDFLFEEKISAPLGLENDIFYLPLSQKNKYLSTIFAATEHCNWRKRVMQKEVHDEHAFLMEGVAGHAGLFGNLNGVITLLEQVLEKWQGKGSKLPFSQSLLQKALQRKYTDKTWCLGFDTPSTGYTSAGKYFSKRSVGHLGYTGTSFWIDPENDCIVVLLTNRVHPSRENKKIREYRPWFHDQVMEYLEVDRTVTTPSIIGK